MANAAAGMHLYAPGGATAICGTGIAVLVALPAADPLVARVFSCVEGTPTLEDVLEVLVSPGLRTVRNFAAAEMTERGTRVIVRGDFVGQVLGEGADVIGSGLWVDRFIDAPATVVLRTAQASAEPGKGLPIGIGVVAADWIGAAGADLTTIAEALPQVTDARSAVEPVAPAPDVAPELEPRAEPAPPTPAEVAVVPTERVDDEPASLESFTWSSPAPEPGAAVAARGAAGEQTEASEGPQPAAQPRQDATPGDLNFNARSGQPDFNPPVSQAQEHQPSGGFIDAFLWGDDAGSGAAVPPATDPPSPWAAAGGRAPAPPAAAASAQVAPARAHVGSYADPEAAEMTVDRRALSAPGGPMVVAAICPAGHLSPAYAGLCRVCRQLLPPQQPFEVPRPPLGVLRMSTGDTITLDRGVIMGRNPHLPSGYRGEQPHLVKLTDPGKDVSSQHLEVSLDYWHVSVKDLGSTNGTEVILPGETPQQLRAHDPITIEPGTRVILAGVMEFLFEVSG